MSYLAFYAIPHLMPYLAPFLTPYLVLSSALSNARSDALYKPFTLTPLAQVVQLLNP